MLNDCNDTTDVVQNQGYLQGHVLKNLWVIGSSTYIYIHLK